MYHHTVVQVYTLMFLLGAVTAISVEAFVFVPGETMRQKISRMMYRFAILMGLGALIFK